MSSNPDFTFVGPGCRARYGRTSRRCLLPVLHDEDHEDEQGRWHQRDPEPVRRLTDAADVKQEGTP